MAEHSQFRLLSERRFLPFFLTQFLGAFNDNFFKNALLLIVTYSIAGGLMGFSTDVVVNLAAGLFILPFVVFSGIAGQVADKYDKALVIRRVKFAEILIMLAAAVGLWFGWYVVLLVLLFLMGTQSTFFGPVKYAIMPQVLTDDELVGGNALVEMGTFVAILLGTLAAGVIMGFESAARIAAIGVVLLAILGYLSARKVPSVAPADPTLKLRLQPLRETWGLVAIAREKHSVFLSILAISWFWFLGAAYLTQFPNFAKVDLLGDLLGVGLFGGLFIVPLYAFVQQEAHPEKRARVIAALNVINALFMVLSALVGVVLLGFAGLTIPEFVLVLSIANLVVAAFVYQQVPEFALRFVIWCLSHTIYRVRHEGLDQIPDDGPALLVCNHVSYTDALVIAGAVRRPVRFVMDDRIFNLPLLGGFFRLAQTIPIAPQSKKPEVYQAAMDKVAEELAEGNIVCIFPEGKLTTDGEIDQFRRGIETLVERSPVPVVPMALQGLWGSVFSHKGGAAGSHPPKRFWSKIGLVAGTPWAPEQVSAEGLEAEVRRLRGDAV